MRIFQRADVQLTTYLVPHQREKCFNGPLTSMKPIFQGFLLPGEY